MKSTAGSVGLGYWVEFLVSGDGGSMPVWGSRTGKEPHGERGTFFVTDKWRKLWLIYSLTLFSECWCLNLKQGAFLCVICWCYQLLIFVNVCACGTFVELYWQDKSEVLGERPVLMLLCSPQTPNGLTRNRAWVSEVSGQRLTAWAMARPAEKDDVANLGVDGRMTLK
jgi:hypothetical protein